MNNFLLTNNRMYYYPRLSMHDLSIFRLGGPGLANCMFFASMAYIGAKRNNGVFISPSWTKFSIGTYIRRERDKRIYFNLFKKSGVSGIKKIIFLSMLKSRILKEKVETFGPYDMNGYFTSIQDYHAEIKEYFNHIERQQVISRIDEKYLKDKIAIHVRLGDYPQHFRVPIEWYKHIIELICSIKPSQQFILLSDGTDEDLTDLTDLSNVERGNFGNAYADMKAISCCKMLLASDSTFSAWGAFLGDVPIIFAKRHFPSVFGGRVPEIIIPYIKEEPLPIEFINIINNIL